MPLEIVRNDITKMHVDAIVNAANSSLLGGGGVDGAIHRAAGPELLAECRSLNGCRTGEAKITKGYRLPAKYVIHTVGPVWYGGKYDEENLLRSCYLQSLLLAEEYGCESVAFPLISSGAYRYPKEAALRVAADTIKAFLEHSEMTVYMVIFDKTAFKISASLVRDIRSYIDDRYVDIHGDSAQTRDARSNFPCASSVECSKRTAAYYEDMFLQEAEPDARPARKFMALPSFSMDISSVTKTIRDMIDESFSEMLLRKIDELGIKDSACYKKANIDRRLFSKIRSDSKYKPAKPTAMAFAIALELPMDEAEELLKKAGYAFSHSNVFDIIVEYFIKNRVYDIHLVNEVLFEFDQPLLGG